MDKFNFLKKENETMLTFNLALCHQKWRLLMPEMCICEMFASAGLKPHHLETEWENGTNGLILLQAPQT